MNKLVLELDYLHEQGHIYTDFDVGGEGHRIIIEEKDKNEFLDAWAKEWRNRAEDMLEELKEEVE